MNDLQFESSPYLKQHENNPVDWKAWKPETLKQARTEDKLMIVSIGYSTCHWCHVMEHDAFEHEDVAAVMNKDYLSIKVDREERPDVDDIYMDAIHLMGQQGGWPLNVVTLPDGRPIWGATYVPKEKWKQVLSQIADLYKNDREKLEEYALKLTTGLKQLSLVDEKEEKELDTTLSGQLIKKIEQQFDSEWGGLNRVPKFPMPDINRFLLLEAKKSENGHLLQHVELTSSRMLRGGIFDQLGGGFARYSVDGQWKVPHFEKMLYDNGQLLSLLAEEYASNPKEELAEGIEKTIEFIKRELTSDAGLFYCGLDADSDGEEGTFYIWTYEEVLSILGAESPLPDYWQLSTEGNWEEGKNVLFPVNKYDEWLNSKGLDGESFKKQRLKAEQKLFEYRAQRNRPGLDNKILCSWNALTVIGILNAAAYLKKAEYQHLATKALDELMKSHWTGDKLFRVKTEQNQIEGFLEDYAYFVSALIRAYESTGALNYLHTAKSVHEKAIGLFCNPHSPLFYSTAEDKDLVARKVNYQDNVTPSANAVMAENFFLLSKYFLNMEYEIQAKKMLQTVEQFMAKDPGFFSYWAKLHARFTHKFYELVISGPQAQETLQEVNAHFLPNVIAAVATQKNQDDLLLLKGKGQVSEARYYLCEGGQCHEPKGSLEEVFAELSEY